MWEGEQEMLFLTSSPLEFKTKSVLHLVHPKDYKNPTILQAIKMIKSESFQIARVGEHLLSDPRFYSFESVVLNQSTDKFQKDLLQRLLQGRYDERFQRLQHDSEKGFLDYGNSVQLLPEYVLLIPKDEKTMISPVGSMSNVDTTSKGLNLFKHRIDINFDPSIKDSRYLRALRVLSNEFPVFLLDSKVLYTSDGITKFGNLYKMDGGSLIQIKKLPDQLKDSEKDTVSKRRIPPIRAIYAPETQEEKQEMVAGESQTEHKEI